MALNGKAAQFFKGPVKNFFQTAFGKGPAGPSKPTASDYYSGPPANWGDPSSWVMSGSGWGGSPNGGAQGGASGGSGSPQVAGSAGFNQANNGQVSLDRVVNFATFDPSRWGYKPITGEPPAAGAAGGGTAGGASGGSQGGYVPAGAMVQGDAEGEAATRQGLRNLQQIGQTGWTDADAQALSSAQRQANLGEQSQRDAVMQQAAARGQGGGGLAQLGALQAQQGGANQAADVGAQLGMARADRQLSANQAAAQLGSSLNDQTYAQQQGRASAWDAWNQWAQQQQTNAVQQGATGAQQSWENENTRRNNQWNRATVVGQLFNGD